MRMTRGYGSSRRLKVLAGVTCVTRQISATVGPSPWQNRPLAVCSASSASIASEAGGEPMLYPREPLLVTDLQHIGQVMSDTRHDQRVRVGCVNQCEPADPSTSNRFGRQQRR